MFTRRDVTKIAAALGLGAAASPKQLQAAALGRFPTPAPTPNGTPVADDPAAFARDLDSVLNGAVGDDDLPAIAPEMEAAFLRLRDACEAAYPALAESPHGREPWDLLQDAAYDWATVAYMNGTRAGAAYEHLRRTLIGPRQPCAYCGGSQGAYCFACGTTGERREFGRAD